MSEKINEKKEELKMKIQKIFTKVRNALNDKEDELLLKIDNEYNDLYFEENILKESEKLPNKISISIKKGKLINKEWNEENKLNELINDCVEIENEINYIKEINNIIEKKNMNQDIEFNFNFDKKFDINSILEGIRLLGEEKIKSDIFKSFKEIKFIIERLKKD